MSLQLTTGRNSLLAAALAFSFSALTGCVKPATPQQDREVRHDAAVTTQKLKQGVNELARDIKPVAANAAHGVDQMAKGVKEGLHGSPSSHNAGTMDINTADAGDLSSLSGISDSQAHRIVKGRPYSTAHALVSRGIVTERQYKRIEDQITAK